MSTLAGWCFRHRLAVIGFWAVLLVAIAALGAGLITVGLTSHLMPVGSIGPTVAALIGLGSASTTPCLGLPASVENGHPVSTTPDKCSGDEVAGEK
jgi:hypothetical protein